jgi:hypothetical protein
MNIGAFPRNMVFTIEESMPLVLYLGVLPRVRVSDSLSVLTLRLLGIFSL